MKISKKKFRNIKLILELPSVYLRNLLKQPNKSRKIIVTNSNNSSSYKDNSDDSDSGNESENICKSSNSSSSDNESYYDALESFLNDDEDNFLNIDTYSDCEACAFEEEEEESSVVFSSSEGNFSFDLSWYSKNTIEYDENDENDDKFRNEKIDMSKEQNIILFVLSQLKFGMELENFSLPCFILEPRSMLEIISNFIITLLDKNYKKIIYFLL